MSENKSLPVLEGTFAKLTTDEDTISESKRTDVPEAAPAKGVADASTPVVSGLFDLGSECCICLEVLERGRALFAAECGHAFHFGCLQKNVDHDEANADKCPICRQTMSEHPQPSSNAKHNVSCSQCQTRFPASAYYCTACGAPNASVRGAGMSQAPEQQLIVSCPRCSVRMMFPLNTTGQRRCPAGHLFSIAPPQGAGAGAGGAGAGPAAGGGAGGAQSHNSGLSGPIYRRCPTCRVHLQIPPGSPSGLYACPHGHQFQYRAGGGM